ncbi:hypothetical protein, conserved [Plasmodium ovale curtisi]|uniref:Rhoptry associated adhesin n=2 Tax=Plasmodium ovale TaxID=36330 RepID=A0A1A8W7B1_PLAOA|nr:hypothetical protein, conserved [Plasmodium ovale curtisi]
MHQCTALKGILVLVFHNFPKNDIHFVMVIFKIFLCPVLNFKILYAKTKGIVHPSNTYLHINHRSVKAPQIQNSDINSGKDSIMKGLFFLFVIYIFKMCAENTAASKHANGKRRKNGNLMKGYDLSNEDVKDYSFLMMRKQSEEKEAADGNNSSSSEKKNEEKDDNQKKGEETGTSEKKGEENGGSEKKNEENGASEKKHEGDNSNVKKNEESNGQSKEESVPPEKKINKENLLEYGTHDKKGNFIPSYKTLTEEILSTNNAMERASTYMKIACSHVMKIIEFIPDSKLSSQYIKIESKNVYLKDISAECQNIFFSLEKLTMTIIVLNSKINKLVYVQDS